MNMRRGISHVCCQLLHPFAARSTFKFNFSSIRGSHPLCTDQEWSTRYSVRLALVLLLDQEPTHRRSRENSVVVQRWSRLFKFRWCNDGSRPPQTRSRRSRSVERGTRSLERVCERHFQSVLFVFRFLFFQPLTVFSYDNLVFSTVDQPVGTGYSYMATNSYVHDLPEASLDLAISPISIAIC